MKPCFSIMFPFHPTFEILHLRRGLPIGWIQKTAERLFENLSGMGMCGSATWRNPLESVKGRGRGVNFQSRIVWRKAELPALKIAFTRVLFPLYFPGFWSGAEPHIPIPEYVMKESSAVFGRFTPSKSPSQIQIFILILWISFFLYIIIILYPHFPFILCIR